MLPAQVDREEVLGNEALTHHVVKDWCGPRGRQVGESQAQDTVGNHVGHEGSLGLTGSKDLLSHRDTAHLETQQQASVTGHHRNRITRIGFPHSSQLFGDVLTGSHIECTQK